MANLFKILFISMVWIQCALGIKCYLQTCHEEQSGNWWCYYSNNGIEQDCDSNSFCYESRFMVDNREHERVRGCTEVDQSTKKKLNTDRQACEKQDRTTYCYCHSDFCNNITRNPDKFNVINSEGEPNG